jgi:hypothetical protein
MMTLAEQPYICQYCKKGFMKENTLAVHICEQKRRALARTEKHVVLGYDTYNRFYKRTQNFKGDKTYDDFAKSPYYNAFVKFGSFVSNANPLYPERFMDYVVTSGVKLDHWCRDELYDKYVVDLIKTETVETALQRSITHMMTWGEDNQAAWNHYFLYVSLSRATYDIKDGKISPWIILNSANGKAMVKKFSDEQLNAINVVMDIPFWLNKFKRLPADVELVKQVVKESNI